MTYSSWPIRDAYKWRPWAEVPTWYLRKQRDNPKTSIALKTDIRTELVRRNA